MSDSTIYAGFYRLDITPKHGGIPLEGLGASMKRRASVIRDRLYANMVALGNGGQVEAVLLTFDWINVKNGHRDLFRKVISEKTGIPEERLLLGGTHTHSGPDIYSTCSEIQKYEEDLCGILPDGVERAVADMKPAKLFYGHMPVGHEGAWLNFCKHYKMAPMEKRDCWTEEDLVDVGDNYGSKYSSDEEHWFYARHEEEADHEIQVMKFSRDDADDIILVNFQAHAPITAHGRNELGQFRTEMSSDFPGVTCRMVEQLIPNTHCAYYQGAAGNLNPSTRIFEEGIYGLTYASREPEAYSAILAAYVKKVCLSKLTESESEIVRLIKHVKIADADHSMDHRLPEATEVWNLFQEKGGQTPEVKALIRKYEFNSPYQCEAIIAKAKKPLTLEVEMNALRIGDVGFVTAPCELFNTTQLFIKAHSPFAMTFVKAYSCGSNSYMPSSNTCKDSYERNCARTKIGTAEEMADKYVEMLNELKGVKAPLQELSLELWDNEWPFTYTDHERHVARAIVVDDEGNYYFAHAERDDDFGKATLIETSGGGVEPGETPEEAVVREIREELGIEAEILCKIGMVRDYYNLIHRRNLNHYFLCKVRSFGEKHLTEQEIHDYHLTMRKVTFEEAAAEYEKCADSSLGRLIRNRELPVLRRAGELVNGR